LERGWTTAEEVGYGKRVRFEEFLVRELAALDTVGRLRVEGAGDAGLVNLASNDYLALATADVSRETLSAPSGARASRLVLGSHERHGALEQLLADWLGYPRALLFSAGYAANLGLVQALGVPDAHILSDELNHASLVDGCRLAKAKGATVQVYPHLRLDVVESSLAGIRAPIKWVVTESYFSMDANSPDLQRLRDLCDRHGAWLVVDEAHALGVLGPAGRGLCAAQGIAADALVGTLGKAIGVQGAFVCGSERLRAYLWNHARSFVFSTGMSPLLASIAYEKLQRVIDAELARSQLRDLEVLLAQRLAALTLPVRRHGPIFPVILGNNARAQAAAAGLRSRGFLVQAIRPPTVPAGSARLRVCLNAALTQDEVEVFASAALDVCGS
jgi:8-amino-7-oxononanoate synthase